jgi:hypothetical protein
VPRKIVSFVAVNIGNASNGSQPALSTWLLRIVQPVLASQGATPAPAVGVSLPTLGSAAKAIAVLMLAVSALAMSACTSTGQLTPEAQQIITIACNVDGFAQPVAVTVAPALGPEVAAAAAFDAALVHPAVQAACKGVGGAPASVTVTPAAVVPTAAPGPADQKSAGANS